MTRVPVIEVDPYRPGKCKRHAARKADVYLKFQDEPGVDLCWECYRETLQAHGLLIQPKPEVAVA
jgi:hypothetical protein